MDTETIADKYEILTELGRGGMGRVYKVLHRGLNKVYALKILREHLVDDESLIARFQNEARIMASLHHANIIQVFDIDRDGDRHYFVMEYIEGQTLGEVLRKRAPLPLSDIITISRQIAQALDYAHQQQPPIIHRDIKPSNIMLEAGTGRVVVTDFGIAKLLDAERTRHTLTGFTVGTPSYAAPEQLRSVSDLDGRADIFPLGLVMYEMLAGRPFFEDMTPEEIIGQKLFDPRELLPKFDPSVPTALQQLIRRAIAKDREQRYPSVAAFLDDLSRFESTGPPPASTKTKRLRHGLTAVSVAMLAGLLLWLFIPQSPKPIQLPAPTAPVQSPKPTEPVPNPPQSLVIIRNEPQQKAIDLRESEAQVFRIEAVDPDEMPVHYQWFLDDEPTVTGESWAYQPGVDDLGRHTVRVEISASTGTKTEQEWRVTVHHRNQTPVIQSAQPDRSLLQSPTGAVDIQIEASDPDGDALHFVWSLNGQELDQRNPRLTLDALENGDYEIGLTVRDAAGANTSRIWQLNVNQPLPVPALDSSPMTERLSMTVCARQAFSVNNAASFSDFKWALNGEMLSESGPQLSFEPQQAGPYTVQVQATAGTETLSQHWQIDVRPAPISEADVNRWIEQYQDALQNQDSPAIRQLGNLFSDSELAQIQARQRYQVTLESWDAVEHNNGIVELSFNQVERWYNPQTYSSVVEHTSHTLTLQRQGCEEIVAARN